MKVFWGATDFESVVEKFRVYAERMKGGKKVGGIVKGELETKVSWNPKDMGVLQRRK